MTGTINKSEVIQIEGSEWVSVQQGFAIKHTP